MRAFGKERSEVEKYVERINYVFQLAKKEAVLRAGFFGMVSGLNMTRAWNLSSALQTHSLFQTDAHLTLSFSPNVVSYDIAYSLHSLLIIWTHF